MRTVKLTLFGLLTLLHIGVLGFGLMLFTSLFRWAPWFEPCGIQILAIWTHVAPALCFLGVLFLLFGLLSHISLLGRLMPFLGAGLLSLPLGVAEWLSRFRIRTPDRPWIIAGTVIAVVLVVAALVQAIGDLKTIWRGKEEDPTMRSSDLPPADAASRRSP